jgi:hypothetical protein
MPSRRKMNETPDLECTGHSIDKTSNKLSLSPSRLHKQISGDEMLRDLKIFALTAGTSSRMINPRKGEYESLALLNNKTIDFFKEESVVHDTISKLWLRDRSKANYEEMEKQIDRITN